MGCPFPDWEERKWGEEGEKKDKCTLPVSVEIPRVKVGTNYMLWGHEAGYVAVTVFLMWHACFCEKVRLQGQNFVLDVNTRRDLSPLNIPTTCPLVCADLKCGINGASNITEKPCTCTWCFFRILYFTQQGLNLSQGISCFIQLLPQGDHILPNTHAKL